MIITERLKAIAQFVPQNSVPIDVGTDHGFIPIFLIKMKICSLVFAADISPGSLRKAQKMVRKYQLEDRIQLRLGNGLTVMSPGEADVAIISGMGGLLIRDILEGSPNVVSKVRKFILQPMIAQDKLRRWLHLNGFMIESEELVKEDERFYEIIVAVHGEEKYEKDIYYEVGLKLIEQPHPLLPQYLKKKIEYYEQMIVELSKENTDKAMQRRIELEQKLTQYKEIDQWTVNAEKS